MPWSVRVLPDLPIVEVCYRGVPSLSEIWEVTKEILALSSFTERPYLLVDVTESEGGLSAIDLAGVAKVHAANPNYSYHKEAIVLSAGPSAVEDAIHWRETAAKAGIRVELFLERRDAIAWLLAR